VRERGQAQARSDQQTCRGQAQTQRRRTLPEAGTTGQRRGHEHVRHRRGCVQRQQPCFQRGTRLYLHGQRGIESMQVGGLLDQGGVLGRHWGGASQQIIKGAIKAVVWRVAHRLTTRWLELRRRCRAPRARWSNAFTAPSLRSMM